MQRGNDLGSLRAELTAAGVFRHREAAVWVRLVLLLAGLGASLAAVVLLPLAYAALLVPVAALLATTAAMLGHEGAHGCTSPSRGRNHALALLTFPLLSGLGSLYWKHKHNVLHHGHPNVVGTDPDLDLWPMASCREDYERSGVARRWFQRYVQVYAFWPLTLMLPVAMRWPSITYLVQHARRHGVDRAWALDAGALAAHYTLWLVVPSFIWGFGPVIALYAALWSLVGLALALIFAPAHIGMPMAEGDASGWRHQLETTRNLRTPRWGSWFFVGLDYQVEHHLFPRIPHQNLPRAREIVRAWCERAGIAHHEVGYGAALASVTRTLRDAWRTPAAETGAAVASTEQLAA